MQYRNVLTGALLALAFSACQPAQPPAAQPEAAMAAQPPAAAAAPAPVAVRDAAAFAGDFAGTVPCADCAGIDMTVSLKADGGYTQTLVYQGEAGEPLVVQGNWRLDEEGLRVKLVPTDTSENAQWFGVVSATEIRLFDQDGKAFDSPLAYTLTRKTQ